MSKETSPNKEYPNSHTVEFDKGSITYSVYGEPNPAHHPIIWVSGAEQGHVNPQDAAELLAKNGQRQVLIYEQPVYKDGTSKIAKIGPQRALDFLAEGVLAAAQDAGFIAEDKVVDVAAHSLGGLVLERMKQQAEQRGIKSLSQSEGSRQVLIAPTGSNSRERYPWLAGRWGLYMAKSWAEAGILDPSGLKGSALQENAKADFLKFLGETRAMNKTKIDYGKFGETLVLVYPEDRMFPENAKPQRSSRRGFINKSMKAGHELAFATPIGPEKVATKGVKRWMAKAGRKKVPGKFKLEKDEEARHKYVRSYRGAGHNHPTDQPAQTVDVLLRYFDHGREIMDVKDLKEATRKFIKERPR